MPEAVGVGGPFCIVWVAGEFYFAEDLLDNFFWLGGLETVYILLGRCETHFVVSGF